MKYPPYKLDLLYQFLLGEGQFQYQHGSSYGPEYGLFLWSVTSMRTEMAKMFWEMHEHPIRSALTACALLRKMANRSEVEPLISDKMKQAAEEFEDMAIGVQQEALRMDDLQALHALECKTVVWPNKTSLDVAIIGRCERFVQETAKSAIDRRFAGDLDPYYQHFPALGLNGFWRVLLAVTFLGGIPAPWVCRFTPPPKGIRRPHQRRNVPIGYPYKPSTNPKLSSRFDKLNEKKAIEKKKRSSEKRQRGRNDLQESTVNLTHDMSSVWMDRLYRKKEFEKSKMKMGDDELNEMWAPT